MAGKGGGLRTRTGPERSLRFLVHLPDVPVLDGEHGEAVVVFVQQRFGQAVLGGLVGAHCGAVVSCGVGGERERDDDAGCESRERVVESAR